MSRSPIFSPASRFRRICASSTSLALLALAGCSAPPSTGGANGGNGADGEPGGQNVNANGEACSVAEGPGVIRRLTSQEYHASLAALFGRSDFPTAEPLTGNATAEAYSTNAAGLWVRDLSAQAIQNHAASIGEWAVATDPKMVTNCSEQTDVCGTQTILNFGKRAFRMPVPPEVSGRYLKVFEAGENFEEALSLLVTAMLQSPFFLYRRELGSGEGSVVSLNDYELASSLSYFLTGAPPDAELSAVVDAGELRDEATWQRQVDRLLNSPEAEGKLVEFVVEWLGLREVLTRTKTEDDFEVPDSLRESMMGEVEALVRHVIQTGGGMKDLLSNDSVFLNAELSSHYGMPGPTGDSFEAVPAGDRTGGLLGTGAYLLGHSGVDSSSPTLRGMFIRRRLLCREILPPPPTVDSDLPPITGPITTRQRFAQHLEDPVCSTCHEQLDNFGNAFESYDGLGRHRTQEAGIDVDTTGVTVDLASGEVPFADSHELVSILVSDEQVERCFHQNLTEYIVGQSDWDNLCSNDEVTTAAKDGEGSLYDSLRAILTLPHIEARLSQGEL